MFFFPERARFKESQNNAKNTITAMDIGWVLPYIEPGAQFLGGGDLFLTLALMIKSENESWSGGGRAGEQVREVP